LWLSGFIKPPLKFNYTMKTLKLLALLMAVTVSSCDLDPGVTMYSNVVIPFEERGVPETGQVDVPVNIYASASMDNGCWSNIHFVLTQKDDRQYEMVALADYESTGACPEMIVSGDTTVTFTPERTGNHIITFWMTNTTAERDTIVIGVSSPAR